MLCSISLFLPFFLYVPAFFYFIFLFLSCFLYLFISSFHITVVSSSVYFCPSFLFVRPVLIPAECLLNPLCPSVFTHKTRELLFRTSQNFMCRTYFMNWLMNLIAVKIGHITDTLHGKLFSLLYGVPTCIHLTNLLREKQRTDFVSISPTLIQDRFDSPKTLRR
jgi:hypothetical protein